MRLDLLRRTYAQWNADDGWLYAAAMAAFAALALAPLLVISLRVAQLFGSEGTVVHGLALVIVPIVGHGSVRSLDAVARSTSPSANGLLTSVLSVVIALFAGSRLFYSLQRALHVMWKTPVVRTSGALAIVRAFLVAGGLSVCAIAFFTVAIFGSAAVAAAAHGVGIYGGAAAVGVRIGIACGAAFFLSPVVAVLFRWLGGRDVQWADVWLGAVTTSVAFAAAQFFIGAYLALVNLPWIYGSAASLIVILLWLYYSSYVFLLGAEFTRVYAQDRTARAVPEGMPPAAA